MICNRWDVVVVPFPFIDKPADKKRPAVVLSSLDFNQGGYTVMAMTSYNEITVVGAGVQVRPVFVALNAPPLHYSGQHDHECRPLLPDHLPEVCGRLGQWALRGNVAVDDARPGDQHLRAMSRSGLINRNN